MRAALSPAAAAELVPDGATVMIGGFMGVGSPHRTIAALVARGARGLTVIANDTARPGVGIGRLVPAGCVATGVGSHLGPHPETQRPLLAGPPAGGLVAQRKRARRDPARGARPPGGATPPGDANDPARRGVGIGRLVWGGCVARAVVSHIATTREPQRLILAGELGVELVPQGPGAGGIGAGGAGLGGVLTATGLGTLAAE